MVKTNQEMLNEAYKSITYTGPNGLPQLNEEQLLTFISEVKAQTVLLNDMQFQLMNRAVYEIARLGFGNRVLTGVDLTDENGNVKSDVVAIPQSAKNKLIAVFIRGLFSVEDRELRRNLEKNEIVQTLMKEFAKQAAIDLEDLIVYGDTTSSDPLLKLTDGLVKKASNYIYKDDVTDATDIEQVFDSLIESIPAEYYENPSDWVFYVPFKQFRAYKAKLRARGTNLGDQAQIGIDNIAYDNYVVKHSSALDRHAKNGSMGEMVMLQNKKNMLWGVLDQLSVEESRKAEQFKTNYVYGMEADTNYTNENMVAIAFLDKTRPVA